MILLDSGSAEYAQGQLIGYVATALGIALVIVYEIRKRNKKKQDKSL